MCFAKMFLESSIWHSTRRLLIWEASGYTCETLVIPACALDAPHRRDRVWIIAYTDSKYIHPSEFENRVNQEKIDEAIKRWQSIHFIRRGATQVEFREADKSLLCREADGIPHELDRLKALGNAIVPYIAHLFFTIITAME
jgi:DNA (cytosine-5)-methyltransferase 1